MRLVGAFEHVGELCAQLLEVLVGSASPRVGGATRELPLDESERALPRGERAREMLHACGHQQLHLVHIGGGGGRGRQRGRGGADFGRMWMRERREGWVYTRTSTRTCAVDLVERRSRPALADAH